MTRTDDPIAHAARRRVGTYLCGRYRIHRLIDIGGMSAIYAGAHRNGRPVAIKVLHERLSENPEVERLFRREAVLANKIRHPGVLEITDDGSTQDGATFLVMPLLTGETLGARAARHESAKLPLEEVIVVATALLDVLRAAHAVKVVHRDIKPDNVFIMSNGDIRVLDFGIARSLEETESTFPTNPGRATGTPAFMAPEQALGRSGDIDGQTDLWAVGATMFTLLCGQLVHQAESTSETIILAATKKAPALATAAPAVPSAICEVVDRALAFDKEARWPDPASMHRAMSAACESVFGVPPSGLPRLTPPPPSSSDDQGDAAREAPFWSGVQTTKSSSPLSPQLARFAGARSPTPRQPVRAAPPHRWPVVASTTVLAALLAWFSIGMGGTHEGFGAAVHGDETLADSAQTSTVSEAEIALEAGLQLWKDGSNDGARKKFAEAARRDPGLAVAHLYFVGASEFLDSEARSHLMEARSLRGRLSPSQAALLDALAPLMEEPPKYALTTARLAAVTDQYPDDPIAWTIRGAHEVRTRQPARLLSIVGHIPGAVASWFRARAELQRGNVNAGRASLGACIAEAPQGAVDCLLSLARLEANEGNCEQSALAAKRLIAIAPGSPNGFLALARAEFGRSHRTDTVRTILELKWDRTPEDVREEHHQRDEFFLAVLDGAFERAYVALDAWEKAVASGSSDAIRRFRPLVNRIELDIELGRTESARQSARMFVDVSQTWLPSDYLDETSEGTRMLYRSGLIPRDEFLARRERDEERLAARGGIYNAPGVRWYAAYAETVVTAEDAQIAVEHEPRGVSILDAETNELNIDVEMGRTYLYAGKLDESLQSLNRATRSCLFWKSNYNIPAHVLYGDALVQSGRPQEACAHYTYALDRWGHDPRSRTARAARESALRIGCPGVGDDPIK